MKYLPSILFFLLVLLFPMIVRGEDSTMILTFRTDMNQTVVKNELRVGLWKKAKDGLDPLDLEAMLNGPVEIYFEPQNLNGLTEPKLWWDIRSSNPWQEWRIQVKTPPHILTEVSWREIHHETGKGPVTYSLLDTETGQLREMDVTSGTFSFSTSGVKTFILKTRPR
jgi:hypothetical protein